MANGGPCAEALEQNVLVQSEGQVQPSQVHLTPPPRTQAEGRAIKGGPSCQ